MEDLTWVCNLTIHLVLVDIVLMTARLKGLGTWPRDKNVLIILRREALLL